MSRGIILFGAMGVGDTTLGKEIANRLQFPHIDLDDYHWRWDTEIPYTVFRSKEERTKDIMEAISKHSHFIMSGSMWSIRKTFEPMFDMAVFITAPAEICAERIRSRSISRWGNRVLPGGDMYITNEINRDYLSFAKSYDTDMFPKMSRAQHEQWIKELPFPVLRADGTKPISENAEFVINQYLTILSDK